MIFSASADMTGEPRATPLYAAAASLSAANSWTTVNGWAAARVYTNVEEEYNHAAHAAALVDLGPFCRYTVRGDRAADMLARLTTTPVGELGVGESARGLILDGAGNVVDFAEIARLGGDLYLLTTTAPIDRRLQAAARGFDVGLANVGRDVAALGVVGPKAREAASAAGFDVQGPDLAAQGRVRGVELAVRPINFGAAPGLEIVYPAEEALTLWERLRRAGKLIAAGLDALDILRIEGGTPRVGVDFVSADRAAGQASARSPAEIGLPHLAPPNRAWFNGRRAMTAASAPSSAPARALVVLAADADAVEPGAEVFAKDESVGRVTSAVFSPQLRRALCFAEIPTSALGEALGISAGAGRVAATVRETAESRLAAAFKINLRGATDQRR
ncbi:MAG: glycine cleavage T C-terminal barrel domain-containing protein [Parvularculaceae bacterium]